MPLLKAQGLVPLLKPIICQTIINDLIPMSLKEIKKIQNKVKIEGNRRLKIILRGAVQGVGFRPFIYRLATQLELQGWVLNSPEGVLIEVEGKEENLNAFLLHLDKEKPPRSIIQSLEFSLLDPVGFNSFEIRKSEATGEKRALVLPEIATCSECREEVFDSLDRRFLYPFTNCTNCGPRFTIIEALPYDRQNTSMKIFKMCPECRDEYEEPQNRRFHAEPNACSACGPTLELWTPKREPIAKGHRALIAAAEAVRGGKILALKGLGGFHLIVDARNEKAVIKLRERKGREEKPFALMFPSLDTVKKYCEVSSFEERLLCSPESPIVLLKRYPTGVRQTGSLAARGKLRTMNKKIAPSVAPHNPYLGVMLPYTPLHHLLMQELGFPVVATSGNLTDEPIVIDEKEALIRLQGIADLFLVHNRPIIRHVDDSIARVILGRELLLRRARGYAPLPIRPVQTLNGSPPLPSPSTGRVGWGLSGGINRAPLPKILAVGAHLKNTIAISLGDQIFMSQHIGDLETQEAYEAFQRVIRDFKKLYEFEPEGVACDMHPDFLSTKYAKSLGLPVIEIQHHHAHVAACMAENELEGPVLGVSWDGTGYGTDGTIWGGEFLWADYISFRRVYHFRTFRLPGGEKAIHEPRRTALGILYELFGEEAEQVMEKKEIPFLRTFCEEELRILGQMIRKGINSPLTSSAGRIFDAVAALINLRQRVSFEGQAAMELEYVTREGINSSYPFEITNQEIIDWTPMILALLEDLQKGTSKDVIGTKFHNTLSEIILQVAHLMGMEKVVLTGGVFQNRYLTERTWRRLEEEGFKPYIHQRVPPNDGGISFGQVMVAASRFLTSVQGC
ncbi:MAG TPA: carbamoyltransferase HypF [Candidatus Limnocylindrales bacterium]|nr:carbamoyltransferase HypF [Candidatus Limnocylindrales bacterium]